MFASFFISSKFKITRPREIHTRERVLNFEYSFIELRRLIDSIKSSKRVVNHQSAASSDHVSSQELQIQR